VHLDFFPSHFTIKPKHGWIQTYLVYQILGKLAKQVLQ
jgi:hypothetical protein